MVKLNFSENLQETKINELKAHLLKKVHEQTTDFVKIADEFYHSAAEDDLSYIDFCRAVITVIDEVLRAGDWESSLFLHNTVKPLKQLRERAQAFLYNASGEEADVQKALPVLSDNQAKVYLSLFQTDGLNLRKWELQLRSINSYLIGRPIYAKEEDVKRTIRSKLNQSSEGYAVLVIDKSLLNNDYYDKTRTDKQGTKLISLVPGSIKIEDIIEFVHQDKHYRFIEGRLVQI